MTKDEIKLVVFILGALLIGVFVQHWRTRLPGTSAMPSTPPPHGWAKPPYVLKEKKTNSSRAKEPEAE